VRAEAEALLRLNTLGVPAPRLLGFDPEAGLLAMQFVEGKPVLEQLVGTGAPALAARLGRTLARVHAAGLALCDGHPGNALLAPGSTIFLIDLEFAALDAEATPERRAFDLAYAAAFLPDEACRQAFLAAYGPSALVAAEAARLAPFAWLAAKPPSDSTVTPVSKEVRS
jgi:tRNA A-37 threonylcarbamoyl transferase component Bud32